MQSTTRSEISWSEAWPEHESWQAADCMAQPFGHIRGGVASAASGEGCRRVAEAGLGAGDDAVGEETESMRPSVAVGAAKATGQHKQGGQGDDWQSRQ